MNLNVNVAIKLTAVILFFTLLACGSATPPGPSSDAVSTIVVGTLEAMTPLASPITQSTTAPLPTSTLAPTNAPPASNLPSTTRINFATGGTEAQAEGSTQSGQTLHFVVGASKDQPMIVTLISPNYDAKLSVFGANGEVLLSASQQLTSWQGILPAAQDYYFGITGSSGADFLLNVVIPARIKFASGQNQITLDGQTSDIYGITYVVYALGGQKMDATLNTDPSVAALTIYGFSDGQPYARAQNGVTDFSMTLPSTQDYIIHVVPHTDQAANYQVTIKIQ
jgi:hypothetical protein